MLVLWALMATYITLEVNGLALLDLWSASHLKDTLIWSLTVAVVLFIQVASEDSSSFKNAARGVFAASVVVDVVVNLYVLPLAVEFVLVPALVFLIALQAVAQTKDEYKHVERSVTNVLALIGGAAFLYVGYSIYSHWSTFARVETAKDFLVPLALSLPFMPFVYVGVLYATYERFFSRLRFYVPDAQLRKRFRRHASRQCHVSLTTLERCAKLLRGDQIASEADMVVFFHGMSQVKGRAPDGYRSMRWGDPPLPECMTLLSTTSSDNLALYKPANSEPFLGLPVREEFLGFTNRRLYQGQVWFDGAEGLQEARVRISALYGPPTFANEYRSLWKWKWPDEEIEIHLSFEPRFNRGNVLIFNNAI